MPGARESSRISAWIWAAVAAALAAVPIVLALGVPATPPGSGRTESPSDGRTKRLATEPTRVPHSSVAPPTPAGLAGGEEGDPDLGVTTPRTPYDVEYDALETEMAILRGEKSAIEAEEGRLRGVRDELESFDRDHPDGVPPELFAHYEDARATYNSDVKAYKSRAAGYQMKLAEMERRVEALRDAAPGAPGASTTP